MTAVLPRFEPNRRRLPRPSHSPAVRATATTGPPARTAVAQAVSRPHTPVQAHERGPSARSMRSPQ
ncbi:MAG: hypothetical protein AMK73_04105 [Planctomycetes bacterium SM23_32]|nr:MAG: hypothetical protein AMK73_04105 [Planctomycetes bacterium SM23_32]